MTGSAPSRLLARGIPAAPGVVFILICGVLFCALLYGAAIVLSFPLLSVPENLSAPADAIVVLGGDGPTRAYKAAEVWKEKRVSNVLVSGDGDCTFIRQIMIDEGVPAGIIEIECRSGSTWDNASASAPFLNRMGAHSAILVTNWFHMRRAMMRFGSACPHIAWHAAPAPPPASLWAIATGPYGPAVLKEYPKVAFYAVRGLVEGAATADLDPRSGCIGGGRAS